ncbi:hypothetical protein [Hymenobacter sp. AT01-02]|uniref:hypothetical protein n=1 Tax=Hymenobacter sp. AT01-02 TaxID=1571877 RepID=UPI0005F1ED6E|nr:hypothetical protein [Hymenobacter sp. AT01-02]
MLRFCLVTLFLAPTVAVTQTAEPKQSRIDPDVWNVTDNTAMPIQYAEVKHLEKLLHTAAVKGGWSAERIAQERTKIPPGGFVLVSFARDTPQLADSKNLSIIVRGPQGKEITRYESARSSPGNPMVINQRLHYQSLLHIRLESPLAAGSRVSIVEAPAHRYEYIIRPL